jgi:hypothetical protein
VALRASLRLIGIPTSPFLPPHPPQVNFVYDCPDFEEFNIFETDLITGAARLSIVNRDTADAHGVQIKNSRGDRFTLVLIPAAEYEREGGECASVEEQVCRGLLLLILGG